MARANFQLEKYSFGTVDGNAVFYQGKVYRMAKDWRLGVFDLTTESWIVHGIPNAEALEAYDKINYLVESDNNLYRVWTDQRIATSVRVYKLDHSGHNWEETRSLGGRCFFVSYDPHCIETTEEFRGEQDMIYFAGETNIVGSFIRFDVRQARIIFSEGRPIIGTFFQNSCWILPKLDHLLPGEESWI